MFNQICNAIEDWCGESVLRGLFVVLFIGAIGVSAFYTLVCVIIMLHIGEFLLMAFFGCVICGIVGIVILGIIEEFRGN